MNVYPRKPLEAERARPYGKWVVSFDDNEMIHPFTDAQFSVYFYPAERLDTLLAAVEEVLAHYDPRGVPLGDLRTAFRAFQQQETT